MGVPRHGCGGACVAAVFAIGVMSILGNTARPSGFVPHASLKARSLGTRRCQSVPGKSWDEQLQELVSQPESKTRQLLARLLQSEKEKLEMEKEKLEMELKFQSEKEKLQSEKEKEKLEKADYQLFIAKRDLLALRGEMTARCMVERFADKIRQEENTQGGTKYILGGVAKRSGATASFLKQAVQKCTPSTTDASTFLKDLYAKLSGQFHHPPWCGPGIKASGKLLDPEKCMLTEMAHEEGFDIDEDVSSSQSP